MPVYEYECDVCGRFDDLVPIGCLEADVGVCPGCGGVACRVVTQVTFAWGEGAAPEGDAFRARHKEWLDSPETRERIRDGRLVPEREVGVAEDSPMATSSITERARLGML